MSDETRHGSSDPQGDAKVRGKLGEFVPDALKKALVAGLGVLFTTEEGVRRLAADFSLPKEVVTFLVAQANSTKSELFKVVGRELREFLASVNLGQEIQKILTSLSFEIKTEIRFIPNDEALVKAKVERKVAVKRRGGGGKDDAKDEVPEPDAAPAPPSDDVPSAT